MSTYIKTKLVWRTWNSCINSGMMNFKILNSSLVNSNVTCTHQCAFFMARLGDLVPNIFCSTPPKCFTSLSLHFWQWPTNTMSERSRQHGGTVPFSPASGGQVFRPPAASSAAAGPMSRCLLNSPILRRCRSERRQQPSLNTVSGWQAI